MGGADAAAGEAGRTNAEAALAVAVLEVDGPAAGVEACPTEVLGEGPRPARGGFTEARDRRGLLPLGPRRHPRGGGGEEAEKGHSLAVHHHP